MTRIGKYIVINIILMPILALLAILIRILRYIPRHLIRGNKPRLVWAGAPMLSLPYSSKAMQHAGYQSISIGAKRYKTVSNEDFDFWVQPENSYPTRTTNLISFIRAYCLFIWIMARFDILHGFFNGAIFHGLPLCDREYFLWKLSGGKLILMPYGSDSFVYSQLPDTEWAKKLKETYPHSEEVDALVAKRLCKFTLQADLVVGCIVHNVCLPRVDVLPVLWYPADLDCRVVFPSGKLPIRITHVSNHRQIKGTDVVEETVAALIEEGVEIELKIIQGADHETALFAIEWADLVIDQIHFGYALAALEALARGKAVITGVTHEELYKPFWMRDAFSDSPILFSGPADLKRTIRQLADNPKKLHQRGVDSRAYVQSHHGPGNTVELFESLYSKL